MEKKEDTSSKCDGDYETGDNNSLKCISKESNLSVAPNKTESIRIPIKPFACNYVTQIVSTGIRSDNVYEAQILLSPEVDLSTIKITVKCNNLRVGVSRPLSEEFMNLLPKLIEKPGIGELVKRSMKHYENLLIPDDIDGDKVRAVVDNKQKLLVLTAPTIKPSKARKRYIGTNK